MRINIVKRICYVLLLSALVLYALQCAVGCRRDVDTNHSSPNVYSSYCFELPEKDGYEANLRCVLKDKDYTCVSVVYRQFDENGRLQNQLTDIFTVNEKGECIYTLELMDDQTPCMVLENEYAFLGYSIEDIDRTGGNLSALKRQVVFIDKKNGDVVRILKTDFQPVSISQVSSGYVIAGPSVIAMYSKNGLLNKKIDIDFSCYSDGDNFFEKDGHYYVVEERELGEFLYHEIDFNEGNCPVIASGEKLGVEGTKVEGQYFFNLDGEYKVDIPNSKVNILADWNDVDIRPPQKPLSKPREEYSLDDDRFAISYEYKDHTAEVILFHRDSFIDRSNTQILKIGGFGVFSDPVLQWIVYQFNTSHPNCRVVLEDYSKRFDAYMPEDRRKALLALTQYFQEGNSPDIFYGTRFDYEYMGRNEDVVNMSEYMKKTQNSFGNLSDTAYQLMFDGKGACYQIFSGYIMYGYSIQEDVYSNLENTSIFDLYQYSRIKEIPCSYASASDKVDTAIRYCFADLWGAYDSMKKITKEDIESLVSLVLSEPVTKIPYSSREDVLEGKVLMSNTTVFCEIPERGHQEEFHYIGYPSIHGSVHLAIPQCCLAISTSTAAKDMCWEIISLLFSEDAQKQTLISGYIPVTQNAIDTFCDISLYPDNVTDEVLKCYVANRKPVDQKRIEHFLNTISSADTVATYDWGVFDIIYDEINSFYTQNRSPKQIAETLEKRLNLYMQENYQ